MAPVWNGVPVRGVDIEHTDIYATPVDNDSDN